MATITNTQHPSIVANETLPSTIPTNIEEISQRSPQEIKALFADLPQLAKTKPTTPSTTSASSLAPDTSDTRTLTTTISNITGENESEIGMSTTTYEEESSGKLEPRAKAPASTPPMMQSPQRTVHTPENLANDDLLLASGIADILASTSNASEPAAHVSKNGRLATRPIETFRQSSSANGQPRLHTISRNREEVEASSLHEAAHEQLEQEQDRNFLEVVTGQSLVFKIAKRAWVSPTLPVDPILMDTWSSRIKRRLEQEITHIMSGWMSDEYSIVLQCMMAGRSTEHLKPHIIIFCASELIRRRLAKRIKDCKWLANYGIPCLVAVHSVTPLSSLPTGALVAPIIPLVVLFCLALMGLYEVYRPLRRRLPDAPYGMVELPESHHTAASETIKGGMTKFKAPTKTPPQELSSSISHAPRSSLTDPDQIRAASGPQSSHEIDLISLEPRQILQACHDTSFLGFDKSKQYLRSSFGTSTKLGLPTRKSLSDPASSPSMWKMSDDATCGVPLYLSNRGEEGSLRTLGGYLNIEGHILGLTVAHGLPNLTNRPTSVHETQDPDSSNDSDATGSEHEESCFIDFGQPESMTRGKARSYSPGIADATSMKPRKKSQIAPAEVETNIIMGDVHQLSTAKDWATVIVSGSVSSRNVYRTAEGDQVIATIARRFQVQNGPVKVLCGRSGLREGCLNQQTASIWRDGGFMDCHQILLASNLVSGDSGSWVVNGHRLFGHIVAAPQALPWAYMMPMYRIRDDIEMAYGKRVKLAHANKGRSK